MFVWLFHFVWITLSLLGWVTGNEGWFEWAAVVAGCGMAVVIGMLCLAIALFLILEIMDEFTRSYEACFGRRRR